MWTLMALMLSAEAVETGQQAPTIEGADYADQVTLVNIWASWCGPCRKELPLLDALQERLDGDGVQVVTVAIDTQPRLAEALLRRLRLDVPVVYDPTGAIADAFAPPKMPTSYVVDGSGQVIEVIAGDLDNDAIDGLETRLRGAKGT